MPSESSKRGGNRQGAGRKPGSVKADHRGTVKQVRWTEEEWQKVEQAAISAGKTPSEFIRLATLAKVQETR